MNTSIIFVVILIAVALGIRFALEGNRQKSSLYKKVSSVFNKSEMAFFLELKRKLPEGYYIFPKMRVIDFLETEHRLRSTIWAKHVDFLIVDSYFKPVMAIEINGKSHLSHQRQKSDLFKTNIFKDSSLPLEVVNVGEAFSETVLKIVKKLSSL